MTVQGALSRYGRLTPPVWDCCSDRNKGDEQIRQCDLYTQIYTSESVAIEARRARKAGENAE